MRRPKKSAARPVMPESLLARRARIAVKRPDQARDENGFAIPEEYVEPAEYVGSEEIPPPIIPSAGGTIAFASAEENFLLAALAGTIIAGIAAVAWAAFSVTTQSSVGYAALAVGFAVGFAVRVTGRGTRPFFGTLAAILTILGCAMGMVLSVCAATAVEQHEAGQGGLIELFFRALETIPITEALRSAFHPIDVFLSVVGAYQAYHLGWRRPSSPLEEDAPRVLRG